MTNDLRDDIRGLVDSVADALASGLERVVERHALRLVAERLGTRLGNGALSQRAVPSSNGTRRDGPSKRSAPAASKRTRADNAGRILAHVRANPGARSEEVRAALGIRRGAWIYAVNALIEAKKIARTGEKRASTLRAV